MPIKRETPISELKLLNTEAINNIASDKILSVYPYYKQLNIARTTDAATMYAWIDNIRSLSNVATSSINDATDSQTIYGIVADFKTELDNIV